ncbi:hypothetical protein K438DRAFT_1966716 [Mycena galopus ATCC 62051]|nr:hypothetical protein K438DRAFT_1966716 [Mycena galopus ATCC 62051]
MYYSLLRTYDEEWQGEEMTDAEVPARTFFRGFSHRHSPPHTPGSLHRRLLVLVPGRELLARARFPRIQYERRERWHATRGSCPAWYKAKEKGRDGKRSDKPRTCQLVLIPPYPSTLSFPSSTASISKPISCQTEAHGSVIKLRRYALDTSLLRVGGLVIKM